MSGFDRAGLEARGFVGFRRVAELRASTGLRTLPVEGGVYVVAIEDSRPDFVDPGTGGWFKGSDPNVAVQTLRSKWVDGAYVVYIGKATSFRTRIGQLIKFGEGRDIGHKGGRYLWQLKGAEELVVAWQVHPDPAGEESALLEAFVAEYGTFPFANLRW